MSRRILITGFGPFPGMPTNPTEQCLCRLDTGMANTEIQTLVIPVNYAASFELLEQKLENFQPDALLMLGVDIKANRLKLERVAKNSANTKVVDNAGNKPEQARIIERANDTYPTNYDLEPLVNRLRNAGMDFDLSTDAGSYVCNYLYFRVLHYLQKQNSPVRALFIHTPLTDELLPGNPQQLIGGQTIETIPAATLDKLIKVFVGEWSTDNSSPCGEG